MRFRRGAVGALVFLLGYMGFLQPAKANSHILDPAFNGSGQVATDFFAASDEATAVAVQPDGRILVAGRVQDANLISTFALVRFTTDGHPDLTFGTGGRVTTGFFGVGAGITALALQPDGRILAAGFALNTTDGRFDNDFALARYTPNGNLDPSFGVGGLVVTDFSGLEDWATSIAVQPDGKVIVAGSSTGNTFSSDFALARYLPNGRLDTTFDGDGRATTEFFGFADQANAVALQRDGRIVVAGFATGADVDSDIALARYTVGGALDQSFDGDGRAITDLSTGPTDSANGIAIESDGRIVVAGAVGNVDNLADFAVVRYTTSGAPDLGFGIGGSVITDIGNAPNGANAVAIQPDGRIIVAGSGTPALQSASEFALARYLDDGTLDLRFGDGGIATTDFSNSLGSTASGVAIQPDGRIVAVGSTTTATLGDFAVARFRAADYDLCLHSGDILLQFDSATGAYLFTRCSTGFSRGAEAGVTRRGCVITFEHTTPGYSLSATFDTCRQQGTASVRIFPRGPNFTITDKNITDNMCGCP